MQSKRLQNTESISHITFHLLSFDVKLVASGNGNESSITLTNLDL